VSHATTAATLAWLQHTQVVPRLGGSLPVFIEAGGEDNEWEAAAEALDDLFLGDAEVW
jgi:hypothetical protein